MTSDEVLERAKELEPEERVRLASFLVNSVAARFRKIPTDVQPFVECAAHALNRARTELERRRG